jgi:hypothetical protein
MTEAEKRVFARKANVLRRQLNREQLRNLIAEQLKDTPEWANNRIAGVVGVDDKTVAAVRTSLEATSEIPKLDALTGADGKARPRKQAKRRSLTIDHDDDHDDEDEEEDERTPDYTEKEWDDLWAGRGKLAKMKQNAFRHAIALIKEGVPPDSPAIAALMKDASLLTMKTPSYDPLFGRPDEERRQWHLFMLFLVRRLNYHALGASHHVEWVLQRSFQNVDEWLGEEGDKFCKIWGMRPVSPQLKEQWAAFATEHASRALPDLIAELEAAEKAA